MHLIRFRAPDPAAGGAHSAPPGSLTGFEGVLLLREGKGMGGQGREGEGEEKEERRKEGKGEGEGGGRLRHGFWGDGRPCYHLR